MVGAHHVLEILCENEREARDFSMIFWAVCVQNVLRVGNMERGA